MKSRRLFLLLLGVALSLTGAGVANAATFNIADGSATGLGNALNTANSNNEDDIINLAPNGLYILTLQYTTGSAYEIGDDNGHTLTINGNGATLRRSTVAGTANFRVLSIASDARATVTGVTFSNGNSTLGPGVSNAADLTLINCNAIANAGHFAIVNQGVLTLTGCVVRGNLNGGILNYPARYLTVNDSMIALNTGGGISSIFPGGSISLNRSAITNNTLTVATGTARGAGIFNDAGLLTLTNSTVSGNTATGAGRGGGIYHRGQPGVSLVLVNTTVANNSTGAGGIGGGIYEQNSLSGSGISVFNSLIATNNAPSGPDIFVSSATLTSQGHNLIGKTDGSSGWVASDLTGTVADPFDPMLGPLSADFIHPLLAGSLALDAADDAVLGAPNNLTTDQRFVPRRVGPHVDIGAFEVEAAQSGLMPIVNTTHEHNDGVCGETDCTLGEAVAFANANPDATAIIFTPGLTGVITTRSTPSGLELITPVTIEGPGARLLTVSGGDVSRIFAVTIDTGPIIISGLTLANGYETFFGGGAITVFTPTTNPYNLTINNCRFYHNLTSSSGGAIYSAGPVVINNCTFSGNIADGGFGGGTHAFGDSFQRGGVTAINCTFSNNRAVGGGAVSNKASGRATNTILRKCTLSGNLARLNGTNMGGGIINQGTSSFSFIRLENTIVAANLADDGAPDISGAIVTASSYNLVGDGTGSTGLTNGVNNNQVGTGGSPINPQLGPLQDNGGPTETRALLANSPAINMGNDSITPARDQRYYTRVGVADIGAFEYTGAIAPLATASRKAHGAVNFDSDLGVGGISGIECRSGGGAGDYSLLLTFATPVTVGNASVTSGIGSVSTFVVNNNVVTANLTGVANAQTLNVRLTNVSDGANANDINTSLKVLIGDTTGNGVVSNTDVAAVKAEVSAPITASNFRTDVNANGIVSNTDVSTTKAQISTTLP